MESILKHIVLVAAFCGPSSVGEPLSFVVLIDLACGFS